MNRIILGLLGAMVAWHITIAQEVKLKTLAIADFVYKADKEYANEFDSFNDMLRTEFAKTRRFTIVERAQMKKAVAELMLEETGLMNPGSAKRVGKLTGANYVLYGSIAETKPTSRTRGQDNEYRINADISIMDSESGEVKLAEFIDTKDFGSLKQVIRTVVQRVITKSILGIYPITIAHVANDEFVLNYGEDFIDRNGVYDVFTQGEAITDPATGAIIAREEKKVGQLRITSAFGKFSKAAALGDAGAMQKGMICRLVRESSLASGTPPRDTDLKKGKIKVAIGQFKYSQEFDLQQNTDRSKPVNVVKPTTGQKGILGVMAEAFVGDAAMAGSRRNPKTKIDENEQEKTAISRKSDVLRQLVETRIVKAGQFDVLLRGRLDELKGELGKDADGDFDPKQLVERGHLLGADYLIYGTITKLSQDTRNTGYSVAGGANTVWMDLTVELHIIDVKSGTIKIADYVAGSVETSKESKGFFGFGTAQEQGGALGDLLANTAEAIVGKVTTVLRPIRVVDVNIADGMVMLNYGEGFMHKGQLYTVYSQGEEIKDPYTGASIGRREQRIGTIRPVEITSAFTKCAVVDGLANITVDMICRPSTGGAAPTPSARPFRERTGGPSAKPSRPEF